MHRGRTMRWIQSVVAAYLVIALAVSPAWGVVINIGTFDGFADAPYSASPTASVTLFLRHSNGKTYRTTTDSRGIATVDVPEGTIESCQAYAEGNHVATWKCNIPVGKKAFQKALKKAEKQTETTTPTAIDTQPNTVVVAANKDRSLTFLGYNPLLDIYFLTTSIIVATYLNLILTTWVMTRDRLLTMLTATTVTAYFVMIFFGRYSGVNSPPAEVQQPADAAND